VLVAYPVSVIAGACCADNLVELRNLGCSAMMTSQFAMISGASIPNSHTCQLVRRVAQVE
jgi:hypothetical protein